MNTEPLRSRFASLGVSSIRDLSLSRVLLYAVVGVLLVVYLLPLEVAIATTFKTRFAVTSTLPHVPTVPGSEGFTLEQWAEAFRILKDGLYNSFLRAIPATVVSGVLGSTTAYALTNVDWRGQAAVLVMFVAAVFFPTQAAIVPLARFWSVYVPLDQALAPLWQLPLLASYHGDLLELVISDVAFGLPICTVLFRAYYQGLDQDLIEAAQIDGASMYTTYRRIVLPLSVPMFAVVFIYQFTQVWNSFLFPLIIMTSSNHPAAPATLALTGLGASLEGTNYGLRMSGALLTALPTLVVFVFAGDKFAKGITSGT